MASGGFNKYPLWKKILLAWTPSGAAHVVDWFNDWKFETIVLAPLAFLALLAVAESTDPDAVAGVTKAVLAISPVWVPIFLLVFFWTSWIHYIRYMFWFGQDMILLEIQIPGEVSKSPAAMEVFLTALWNSGGESTFIHRIWKGQFRAIWSLEVASNEGRVAFYIHLRRAWREIVESRLYGQYPEAKVVEVEDYASKVNFNLDEYDIFGTEYTKTEPHAMPIKSYIDYELNKNPDVPEIQVDPITHMLEQMGNLKEGEHLWLQIIAKARKKDEWYGFYLNSVDKFRSPAVKKIADITQVAIKRAQDLTEDEAEKKRAGTRGSTLLSGGEKLRVEAIERSLTKLVFECGVRAVYLAKKGKFKGINNGALIHLFVPFRYPDFNALSVTRGMVNFDYPWQDWSDIRKTIEKEHLYFRYRHRAYFYVPYDQVPVFMTTEELATIWHFPSSAVQSPGLQRVTARRAEAPSNLPTAPANLPI